MFFGIRIESEKVNYKNKIKEEKQDEIENLKREKEEITNISRNKKNKNEWYCEQSIKSYKITKV